MSSESKNAVQKPRTQATSIILTELLEQGQGNNWKMTAIHRIRREIVEKYEPDLGRAHIYAIAIFKEFSAD